MDYFYCLHRPGKLIRGTRICRICRVAIEPCPCGNLGRNPARDCNYCEGLGWVSIVRSKLAALRESL